MNLVYESVIDIGDHQERRDEGRERSRRGRRWCRGWRGTTWWQTAGVKLSISFTRTIAFESLNCIVHVTLRNANHQTNHQSTTKRYQTANIANKYQTANTAKPPTAKQQHLQQQPRYQPSQQQQPQPPQHKQTHNEGGTEDGTEDGEADADDGERETRRAGD